MHWIVQRFFACTYYFYTCRCFYIFLSFFIYFWNNNFNKKRIILNFVETKCVFCENWVYSLYCSYIYNLVMQQRHALKMRYYFHSTACLAPLTPRNMKFLKSAFLSSGFVTYLKLKLILISAWECLVMLNWVYWNIVHPCGNLAARSLSI